jgi:hypothetical protein
MVEEFVPARRSRICREQHPGRVYDARDRRQLSIRKERINLRLILNGFVEDFQARHAFVFKFPARQARKLRVVQTEQCDWQELWNVHEIRFYEGTHELPRLPEWRLSAS